MKLMNVKELPEVTANDNGKVLAVENGEYVLSNSGGGGGIVFATLRVWEEDNNYYETFDMTYDQVKSVFDSGKLLVVKSGPSTDPMVVGNATCFYFVASYGDSSPGYFVTMVTPNIVFGEKKYQADSRDSILTYTETSPV